MADTFMLHSPTERFDMTTQDPPQFSQAEWLNIVETRLRSEGLGLSDLPDVEEAAEFSAVLAELGFHTALERMNIRKAVRSMLGQPKSENVWGSDTESRAESESVTPRPLDLYVPHKEVDTPLNPMCAGGRPGLGLRSRSGTCSSGGLMAPSESPVSSIASTCEADAHAGQHHFGRFGAHHHVASDAGSDWTPQRQPSSGRLPSFLSDTGSGRSRGPVMQTATSGTKSDFDAEMSNNFGRAIARLLERSCEVDRRQSSAGHQPSALSGSGPLPMHEIEQEAAREAVRTFRSSSPQRPSPWRQQPLPGQLPVCMGSRMGPALAQDSGSVGFFAAPQGLSPASMGSRGGCPTGQDSGSACFFPTPRARSPEFSHQAPGTPLSPVSPGWAGSRGGYPTGLESGSACILPMARARSPELPRPTPFSPGWSGSCGGYSTGRDGGSACFFPTARARSPELSHPTPTSPVSQGRTESRKAIAAGSISSAMQSVSGSSATASAEAEPLVWRSAAGPPGDGPRVKKQLLSARPAVCLAQNPPLSARGIMPGQPVVIVTAAHGATVQATACSVPSGALLSNTAQTGPASAVVPVGTSADPCGAMGRLVRATPVHSASIIRGRSPPPGAL